MDRIIYVADGTLNFTRLIESHFICKMNSEKDLLKQEINLNVLLTICNAYLKDIRKNNRFLSICNAFPAFYHHINKSYYESGGRVLIVVMR